MQTYVTTLKSTHDLNTYENVFKVCIKLQKFKPNGFCKFVNNCSSFSNKIMIWFDYILRFWNICKIYIWGKFSLYYVFNYAAIPTLICARTLHIMILWIVLTPWKSNLRLRQDDLLSARSNKVWVFLPLSTHFGKL